MKNSNSTAANNKQLSSTPCVIKVNPDKNPDLLSKKQWENKYEDDLPGCWMLQYKDELDKQYSSYLDKIEPTLESQQQDISLTDVTCKRNATFSVILVTVQTSQFISDIQLVLQTSDGDEVSLCSLKYIKVGFDAELLFEDQRIDFAQALNERIPDFCLPSGQKLLLRVTGGILLTDNILLYASYS